MLFQFLEATQPKKMERPKTIHGDFFERRFLNRMEQELSRRGVIDCLRNGIKDRGVSVKLAYNKPQSTLNKLLMEYDEQNICTENRKCYNSEKNKNSLEDILF